LGRARPARKAAGGSSRRSAAVHGHLRVGVSQQRLQVRDRPPGRQAEISGIISGSRVERGQLLA
jgi:hypothetical protein